MTYDVRNCAEHISRALSAEMCRRPDADGLAWIENERRAVVEAANAWTEATGVGSTITADDVLSVEGQAVGHFDYQRKLSLYVAEVVLGHHKNAGGGESLSASAAIGSTRDSEPAASGANPETNETAAVRTSDGL